MYYSYEDFLTDLITLKSKVEAKIGVPDALVCIARGGMTMGHMLALAWNIRAVYSINAISYSDSKVQSSLIIENTPTIKPIYKKILLLDEIVDSGESLNAVLQKLQDVHPYANFMSAVIFQKSTAKIRADFYIKEPSEWIDFFWEVDMLENQNA